MSRRWRGAVHVPTSDAHAANELFRTLGRQNKMLLAARDERAVRRFLEELSANSRGMVLAMCDRYREANK